MVRRTGVGVDTDPGGQSKQVELPSDDAKRPDGQSTHVDDPDEFEYVLKGQTKHEEEAVDGEYRPAPHGVARPFLHSIPTGQGKMEDDPSSPPNQNEEGKLEAVGRADEEDPDPE